MNHETEKFFFSVTEASRLTGIDKKGIYGEAGLVWIPVLRFLNKCGDRIVITDRQRKGRKFTEAVISFDDVVTLSPVFNSLYLSRILSLFTLFGESGLAFRVNEVTWLLGLSNQWVFGQIKKGVLPVKLRRREHREKAEKLILAQDLRKLKDEPMNIKEKVFELFTLK